MRFHGSACKVHEMRERMLRTFALFAVCGSLAACGGGANAAPAPARPTDGSATPESKGSGPIEPRTDACAAPPSRDANPLQRYAWQAPTPTLVVTSAADAGAGSLRETLLAAKDGDVIGFAPALAKAVVELDQELTSPSSIVLDATAAPGLTLDGQNKTRILTTGRGKDTTLVGLRFVNGKTTGPGGALHVEQVVDEKAFGSAHILGCSFEHNSGGRGGAVRFGWRMHAVVENSVFVDNDGSIGTGDDRGFSGGAISTSQSASLVVRRSRFERNRGTICGAVYNILQPLTIEDSLFLDNVGIEGSGAVFSDGGNAAGPPNNPKTGLIGEMTLRRVRIEGSHGSGAGGAMLLWGYPRDVITITGSVIKDSVCEATGGDAKGGGARLHALDRLLIQNSSFIANRAEQQGGALWIDGDGRFDMENSTFSGNVIDKDQGAGFTYNGHGIVNIASSLFTGNTAGRACGAFWFGDEKLDITVRNSIFDRNQAGQDITQRHVGYRPKDGGGNLEFAEGEPQRGRIFDKSRFADPRLGALSDQNGSLLHPLSAGSPAVDAATSSAPALDARGAKRSGAADIGPFELNGACGG